MAGKLHPHFLHLPLGILEFTFDVILSSGQTTQIFALSSTAIFSLGESDLLLILFKI